MKKILISLITIGLLATQGCEKYLDVNTNPNGPTAVSPYLYLSPMLTQIAEAIQYDSRMFCHYTQNLAYYTADYRYDIQGTAAWTSDMAQYWRCIYWSMGMNLSDMIEISESQERWDLAGIGYALRAWGWQQLVDIHGPVIIKEAFQDGLKTFNYDTEEFAYETVQELCQKALEYLNRTEGAVSAAYAAQGDMVYDGDVAQWIKFVYGILAMNQLHLSNKSSLFDAQKVIEYVDMSFESNDDNFLIPFEGSSSSNANFYGPTRANFRYVRTATYIVSLLNGTVLGTPDPRMSIMLPPSDNLLDPAVTDAQYIGVTPAMGYSSIASADQPYNLYGIKGIATPSAGTTGMYMFKDQIDWPMLTYSELQFMKAEAAFRSGEKITALDAYNEAVSAAIDFTNKYTGKTTFGETEAVSPADKSAFLNAVVPVNADDLTMSMIMCQKYVHQWIWGSLETWMDLRRFHYTDTYGSESTQVFAGFTLPSLDATNEGKTVNRVRPRYNSEYVWNAKSLEVIGALETDYHTEELWATKAE